MMNLDIVNEIKEAQFNIESNVTKNKKFEENCKFKLESYKEYISSITYWK